MDSYSLPQELIDRILDFLHNDPQSLSQCRTVCKCWLPCASYHLFDRLTVDRLLGLSRSTVMPYVRSLRINYTGYLNGLHLPVLGRLTGLREVRLENLDWSQLSSDAQRELSDLFSRLIALEIRKLVLPSLNALHALILSTSSLRRLSMRDILYDDSTISPNSLPSNTVLMHLQQLSLAVNMHSVVTDGVDSTLQLVSQYIPASLTLLEVEANQNAADILHRIGPSLQHLKIMCRREEGTQDFLAAGGLVHSTELMTITIELFDGIGGGVTSILCTIISPSLHTVVITGSGRHCMRRSSARDLEILATKFMDAGLSIGNSRVKLRILYAISHPTAQTKRDIHDKYRRAFHFIDLLGRLEVKWLKGNTLNSYSPFEIFKKDTHLG